MSSITFSEIMDFYPQHNRSVYEDLKKDYQRGSLIPFVGAGLSVFCGYLGWPKVLERLAGFIYDNAARTKILKMIDDEEQLIGVSVVYREKERGTGKFVSFVDLVCR